MSDLLLVDDEPDLAVIVSLLAKRAGHALTVCPDVPSAWARLQEKAFDLVLLDVNLPGLPGPDLCRRLRADARLAEVPVALFVQPRLTADIAVGLEAGADFLISKELVTRPGDWQKRLDEVLAHGRRGRWSLEWTGECHRRPPADWVMRLRRALAVPAARQLGPEALRALLRHAFADGGPLVAEASRSPTNRAADQPPSAEQGEQVARALRSLAERMSRLLGGEVSEPFRALLQDTAGQ